MSFDHPTESWKGLHFAIPCLGMRKWRTVSWRTKTTILFDSRCSLGSSGWLARFGTWEPHPICSRTIATEACKQGSWRNASTVLAILRWVSIILRWVTHPDHSRARYKCHGTQIVSEWQRILKIAVASVMGGYTNYKVVTRDSTLNTPINLKRRLQSNGSDKLAKVK